MCSVGETLTDFLAGRQFPDWVTTMTRQYHRLDAGQRRRADPRRRQRPVRRARLRGGLHRGHRERRRRRARTGAPLLWRTQGRVHRPAGADQHRAREQLSATGGSQRSGAPREHGVALARLDRGEPNDLARGIGARSGPHGGPPGSSHPTQASQVEPVEQHLITYPITAAHPGPPAKAGPGSGGRARAFDAGGPPKPADREASLRP